MIGQSAGKSYAYLLGVYLGDGCVTTGRGYLRFRLNTIDMDFALAVKKAICDLSSYAVTVNVHAVRASKKPNVSLACGDPALCERLMAETDGKMTLPSVVFGWPVEWQREVIAGLMDSEGFVARKTNATTGRSYYMGFKSCDVWVPDFIRLLQGVGIRVGKVSQEKPRKPGYKTPTRFAIKMQSWVDSGCRFNIARKQERVDEWNRTEPYTQRSYRPRRLTSETTRQTAA